MSGERPYHAVRLPFCQRWHAVIAEAGEAACGRCVLRIGITVAEWDAIPVSDRCGTCAKAVARAAGGKLDPDGRLWTRRDPAVPVSWREAEWLAGSLPQDGPRSFLLRYAPRAPGGPDMAGWYLAGSGMAPPGAFMGRRLDTALEGAARRLRATPAPRS